MARNRLKLALIIICVPILATVITAFRIRDLPKSHDSSKLETKTQQCEHCDVKVGPKVHSVKIESDKHKYEDLKKAVREKQLINEKTSETKTTHKFSVQSDKDENEENDLEFPNIQTGFRQEYSKDKKLSRSESNIKHKSSVKKTSFDIHQIDKVVNDDDDDNDDDENEDDNDDDDIKGKSKPTLKPKISEVKKPTGKLNIDAKRPETKVAIKKHKYKDSQDSDNDDENDDDDNEDGKKYESKSKDQVILKHKINEIKLDSPAIQTSKSASSQAKVLEIKQQKSYSQKNDSSEDDEDDDDDDDEDNDDYKGLDNIDELFKILDMKPSSKLNKGSSDKKQKTAQHIEIKTETFKESKTKIKDNSYVNDDDEDDDEKLYNKTPIKSTPSIANQKNELNAKKQVDTSKDLNTKQEKNNEHSFKDKKDKNEETIKQPTIREAKSEEKDLKLNPSTENKKLDPVKKDEKFSDKTKTNDHEHKSGDKENAGDKDKLPTVTKKEEEKDKKGAKSVDDKLKSDSSKKTKEPEKEIELIKPQEKYFKISSHEDKKPGTQPKKDQTDHKDIFQTPDLKKDIKYDFEKPNAYKDSHKSFDYTEFEKLQVTKNHHKEKKQEKALAETDSDSREEKYLKHVTDALNRRNLLKSEFEDFYSFFPTFAPNFSRIHNPECRRHGQILLRQLRGTKLWALNMLDATAKIPSGVLQGNGIQLGDFDQCLGSRARVKLDSGSVVKVQGKYCLARLDVKAEHTELEAPVYLAQAKSLIRSRIDDPGHFVPRFSTLSWGVCVPSACDREDVEVFVKDALKHYQHKSGLVLKVKVDEDDCHTDEDDSWEEWLEMSTVLTLSLYGVILLLVFVATVQDFIARKQPEEGQEETDKQPETDQKDEINNEELKKQSDGILSPFSLYRTISKLIAPGTTDEIACIHGIRGIATIALLVAHKFMPIAVMPYTNRLKITEMASSPIWSWCRAGWVFTDCFLLLSGTLTSHRIASDNDKGALRRLFSRYLRLTPALLAVVLFYAYVWDKLSTGPMWGSFVTKNAEICQQSWWWNLLYLQNYFGMENMCAPHTHQLALDMQLTILGGIIVWAIQSGLSFAKLLLPAAHLLSAYFRYTTVRDHRLTLLAYHGVSVSQLYRTARLSYTSTLHRCSPYLIGISLGLALQKPSKHGKFLIALGWLTSIALAALVVWSGLDSGSMQYRYNANFAAQYATIAPLASAMATAWVIYAVHCGTCDFLSRMLCWRPLVFISRLSYALYLCQFIIFITNIGTVRTAREFTLMSLIDAQEILAIILTSIVLTVTFVIPMQSLHKIFSFQWKSDTDSSETEKEESGQKAEEPKIEEKKEAAPLIRSRHNLIAHREMLEEILEMEVEYETQRGSTEGLDEIVEEEEGTIGDDEDRIDDLEIIEEEEAGEEEAGEEEAWQEREGERSYSRQDDQDLDEWEWTANSSGRSGAQYYRYAR